MPARLLLLSFLVFLFGCSPDFQRQKYTDFGHRRAARLKIPAYTGKKSEAVQLRPDAICSVPAALFEQAPEELPDTLSLFPVSEDTIVVPVKDSTALTQQVLPGKQKEKPVYEPYERNEKAFRIFSGSLLTGLGIGFIALGVASIQGFIPVGLVFAILGIIVLFFAFRGRKVLPPSPMDSYPEGDADFLKLCKDFRNLAQLSVLFTVIGLIFDIASMFQTISWLALVGGPFLFIAVLFTFIALAKSKRIGKMAEEKHFRIDSRTQRLRKSHRFIVGLHILVLAALFVYGNLLIYGIVL